MCIRCRKLNLGNCPSGSLLKDMKSRFEIILWLRSHPPSGSHTPFFSLEDLRQSESVSSFREEISRVSSEWSYEKQRLKNVIEDKEVSFQGLG